MDRAPVLWLLRGLAAAATLAAAAPAATAGPRIALVTSVFEDTPVGGATNAGFFVTNTGDAALDVTEMALTGPDADQLHFYDGFDPFCGHGQVCTADYSLAPGASRGFDLLLEPTRPGTMHATLTVSSNAENPVDGHADLSFVAAAPPRIAVSPAALEFPVTRAETGSTVLVIDVTNRATPPALRLDWSFSTDPPPGFTVSYGCHVPAPDCGTEPGQTYSIFVGFQPQHIGTWSFPIAITSNDPTAPRIEVPVTASSDLPRLHIDDPASGWLDLGAAPVGQATAPGTVTVRNDSGVELRLWSVSVRAVQGEIAIATGPACSSSSPCRMAPRATLTWTVTGTPAVHGDNGGEMSFDTDAEIGFYYLPIACAGYGEGLAVVPGSVGFGEVALGASATRTVVVRNTGTVAHTLTSIAAAHPAFTAGLRTGSLPLPLAPGAEATVDVTFAPTVSGAQTTAIAFGADPPDGWTLGAAGTGVLIGTELTPTEAAFGRIDLPITGVVPAIEVQLRNLGERAITVQGVALDAPADFAVTDIGPGTTIAPGGTARFAVRATPSALGMRRALLTLDLDTVPDVPMVLWAYGQDPSFGVETPDGTPDDFALDLGAVDVDVGARTGTVTVHNRRDIAVELASCTVSGDAAFAVTGGCATTVAAGGTVDIPVAFDPSAEAAYQGTLTVTGAGFETGVATVALTGLGLDQHLALSTLRLDFPDTFRHPTAPAMQRVAVQNTGAEPLELTTIAVEGDGFSRVGPAAASIPAGGSADVTVAFAPITAGAFTGQLVLGNGDDPAMARVALAGRGVARTVEVSPLSIDLGTVAVGETRRLGDLLPGAIAIRNLDAAATFTIARVTLDGSAAYRLLGPDPLILGPGRASRLDLELTPAAPGAQDAVLTIYLDGDPDPHARITVTAQAIEPGPDDGCGCAAGGGPGAGLAALALGLVIRLRRRRPGP